MAMHQVLQELREDGLIPPLVELERRMKQMRYDEAVLKLDAVPIGELAKILERSWEDLIWMLDRCDDPARRRKIEACLDDCSARAKALLAKIEGRQNAKQA